jgi:hypothetical protein
MALDIMLDHLDETQVKKMSTDLGAVLSKLPELDWLIGLLFGQNGMLVFDTPLQGLSLLSVQIFVRFASNGIWKQADLML